jgi:hypothetical protein
MLKKWGSHNNTVFFLLIFLLIALLPFYWLREGIPIAYWDSPLIGLFYPDMMDDARFVWYQSFSAGSYVGTYHSAYIPVYLFYSMLQHLPLSVADIQAMLLSGIMFLSLFAMYLLVVELFNEHKSKNNIAFLSSLFYVLNHISLIFFLQRLTYTIFYLPFVPIFLYLVVKASRSKRMFPYALLIPLVLTFFSMTFFNPKYWSLVIFIGTLLYFMLCPISLKTKLKFLILSFSVWYFLNGFFTIPLSVTYKHLYSQAEEEASARVMFEASTLQSDLLSTVRLVLSPRNLTWDLKKPWWKYLYFNNPFLILVNTLIIVIAFFPFLTKEDSKSRKLLLFFSIVAIGSIFFAKSGNEPLGSLTEYIVLHIPFSRIWSASYDGFQLPIFLSYSILFGYGVCVILEIIKSKFYEKFKKFLVSLFIILLFIHSFPYFTGSIITDPIMWGDANVTSFTKIPEYYFSLKDFIYAKKEDFKLASLPIVPWNMPTFRWEYGYLGVDFRGNFFGRGVFSNMGSASSWDKGIVILENALRDKGRNLQGVLGILNVRYVILHRDIDVLHGNYIGRQPQPIEEIEKIIFANNLTYIRSFGPLDLYEVSDLCFRPHIYPATVSISVNAGLNYMYFLLCSDDYIKNNKMSNNVIIISNQVNREQWSFLKTYNNTVSLESRQVSVSVYNGMEKPFYWRNLSLDGVEARYFIGIKTVVRTDGEEYENTLSFPSLKACPYKFPSFSPTRWDAFNSTLLYIETGSSSLTISGISVNGERIVDIVGIWWETGWVGMGTKPIELPVTIPPRQKAIIQINHIIHGQITLNLLDMTNLTKLNNLSLPKPLITFKKVNPTKYIVVVKNATQPFFLVFSESYDPQWKVYVEDKSINFDKIVVEHPDVNVKEAIHDWDMFTVQDVSYLFKEPAVNETYHFIVNGYANAWYIDPNKIDKNNNGEFTITIYFLGQSLFYLGLIISFITFIACVGYLIYQRGQNRANWDIIITLKKVFTKFKKAMLREK